MSDWLNSSLSTGLINKFTERIMGFSPCIVQRITKQDFAENQDYISFSEIYEKPQGDRPVEEYGLTIDMVKELVMLNSSSNSSKRLHFF